MDRLKKIFRTLKLTLILAIFMVVIAPEWATFQDETYRLNTLIGQRQFDYLLWDMSALWAKGTAELAEPQAYLTAQSQKELVLEFLELVRTTQRLSWQIEQVYIDPDVTDPDTASANLQQELDATQAKMNLLQPVAEAVLQEQVATILTELGFDYMGQIFPPVSMQMTPLPAILVVSPRDRIEQIYNISLQPGVELPAKEALENNIYTDLDRSALIVPIGGVGIFPAMVLENGDINWLANTIAHEWAHHWLTLRPLGIRYGQDPALRTINETVASVFGDEVGRMVVDRYYPELAPPPPPTITDQQPATSNQPPLAFNFRAEMAETRIQADQLLSLGLVEQAEAYMEERRILFVENGYGIRKINQAYFAFYGAYADQPGATGEDPIGPLVRQIRGEQGNVLDFMVEIAGITSFTDLQSKAKN